MENESGTDPKNVTLKAGRLTSRTLSPRASYSTASGAAAFRPVKGVNGQNGKGSRKKRVGVSPDM